MFRKLSLLILVVVGLLSATSSAVEVNGNRNLIVEEGGVKGVRGNAASELDRKLPRNSNRNNNNRNNNNRKGNNKGNNNRKGNNKNGRKKNKNRKRGKNKAKGMVVVRSTNSFNDTIATLRTTLTNIGPISIIGEVPHSAAAAGAGLSLLPNFLFVFGNPALGTPLMQANRTVGLDLPQKMLVWENRRGKVFVGYNAPDPYLTFRHGAGLAAVPQLATITGALGNIASAATGVAVENIRPPQRIGGGRRRNTGTGLVTTTSDADFNTTYTRLIAAITASPASVFVEVDHAANAVGAGLTLDPTKLVLFGNPNLGTPLMQNKATSGIDLPLKMLVWQDNGTGTVKVTTNAIDFIQKRHKIGRRINAQLTTIQNAVNNFVTAATVTATTP